MSSPRPETSGETAIPPGIALADAARALAGCLRDAGIPTPDLDARILLCHVCGITHEQFVADPNSALSVRDAGNLQTTLERRLRREPVSRIVGRREFHGLEFSVASATLVPRPDTETLVEAALSVMSAKGAEYPAKILDLGTGTGCVLVSLLHALPNATGVGTDLDPEAIETARRNAAAHGVADRARFVCTRWAAGVGGAYDLVVSNPPYIPSHEIDDLEPEVARHDPRLALDGGADGLDAYREITDALAPLLAVDGWVVFEVGAGQDGDVAAILDESAGALALGDVTRWPDLAGRVRCVGAKRSPRSV